MARGAFLCLAVAASLAACPPASRADQHDFLTVEQRAADFASFCRFVEEEYAYFDLKKTDWGQVCKIVRAPSRLSTLPRNDHLRFVGFFAPEALRATAARMSALNAFASISSPS
jgi:hypothetical protein